MSNVNDPNNDKSRLQSARSQINELPDEDAQMMQYWLQNGGDDYSASTKVNHISHLLTIYDELSVPFTDATKFQWTSAIASLADQRGWTDGTKRNYQKSARSFLDDLGGDVVAEKDDISLVTDDSGGKISEEDILSLDEVRVLIQEASNRVRDQAF